MASDGLNELDLELELEYTQWGAPGNEEKDAELDALFAQEVDVIDVNDVNDVIDTRNANHDDDDGNEIKVEPALKTVPSALPNKKLLDDVYQGLKREAQTARFKQLKAHASCVYKSLMQEKFAAGESRAQQLQELQELQDLYENQAIEFARKHVCTSEENLQIFVAGCEQEASLKLTKQELERQDAYLAQNLLEQERNFVKHMEGEHPFNPALVITMELKQKLDRHVPDLTGGRARLEFLGHMAEHLGFKHSDFLVAWHTQVSQWTDSEWQAHVNTVWTVWKVRQKSN
jgi:hypothetical protein